MTIAKGWSTVKSVYRESAWGTHVTPANAFGCNVRTIGMTPNRNMVEDPTMSSDRNMLPKLYGNMDVTGTIETTLNPTQSPFWLAMCFGTPTTTGSSAPYSHTYDPRTLPSFTLEQDHTDDIASTVLQFPGCRVTSGSITLAQEGPATLSMNVAAKKMTLASAPLDATPTYPTHTPWGAEHAKLSIDSTWTCGVIGATINFDNQVDTGIYTLPCSGGTYGERAELPEGQCSISGTLDLHMDTEAKGLLDKAIAKSTHEVHLAFTFGTGDGSAVGKEKITFQFPAMEFGLFAPPINTRSGLRVTVPFTCAQRSLKSFYITLLSPAAAAALYLA